jgi:hypothetical protein
MTFYSYSQPTLDLDDPDHQELVRQFVLACRLELRKRAVKTHRKTVAEPAEIPTMSHMHPECSSHSAPPRRRRTAC